MAVLVVKKDVVLCDFPVQFEDGKVDLQGVFNEVQPDFPYPYRIDLCVFAQLVNGIGKVQCLVDFRYNKTRDLIRTTHTREVVFRSRKEIVSVAFQVKGLILWKSGMYSIELLCDNQVVGDAYLLAHPPAKPRKGV